MHIGPGVLMKKKRNLEMRKKHTQISSISIVGVY